MRRFGQIRFLGRLDGTRDDRRHADHIPTPAPAAEPYGAALGCRGFDPNAVVEKGAIARDAGRLGVPKDGRR